MPNLIIKIKIPWSRSGRVLLVQDDFGDVEHIISSNRPSRAWVSCWGRGQHEGLEIRRLFDEFITGLDDLHPLLLRNEVFPRCFQLQLHHALNPGKMILRMLLGVHNMGFIWKIRETPCSCGHTISQWSFLCFLNWKNSFLKQIEKKFSRISPYRTSWSCWWAWGPCWPPSWSSGLGPS